MMRVINTATCCLVMMLAGLLGLTLSLPMQAPALFFIGLGGVLSGLLVYRHVPNWRWAVAALIAIVYFLLRASMSPVADLAMEDVFLVSAAGLFYLLAGPIGGTVEMRISLALVVVLLLILHLGAALHQLAGGDGYSMIWELTNKAMLEGNVVTGMYSYRGSFANFAIIAGILSLCLGLWGRFAIAIRVLFVSIGAIALVCACMAHSRSAMISLVVGGIVLIVMLWLSVGGSSMVVRRRVRIGLMVLGCVGLLTTVAGAVMVFKDRAQHTATGADVMFDSDSRLAYWSMAAEQFVDHPVFGAGSRRYSYECFHYWSPNLDTGEANPEFVHNEYLQLLADYGILGFLFVVFLLSGHIFVGISRVRTLARKLPENGLRVGSNAMALAIAGVVGIVVMAVHNMFDFRTHLMANLLLLMCCLLWVLPVVSRKCSGERNKFIKLVSAILVLIMAAVGTIAIYSGLNELRGGLPLLKNKMAEETGGWDPSAVPREVWIPALEESIKLVPSYRRHLRLGALYQLEATNAKNPHSDIYLRRAISQYVAAEKRHAFEPVAKLNLACLYGYFGDFKLADEYFKHANMIGASRERWFRIHTKWADMHRQWAADLWEKNNTVKAEEHYIKAIEILESGSVQSSDTINLRRRVIIEHVRMLDSLKRFEEADKLYENLELVLRLHQINSKAQNIRREMGEHYLRHAKHLWYDRKPVQAQRVLLKAKKSYHIHRLVLKGVRDPQAEKGYDEVKKILAFFKETGVGD